MLQEYIMKKTLDAALNLAKGVLREAHGKLLTTREDLTDSITYHLRDVKNWSTEVSFNDLKKAKRTTDIYIDLDLFVYPRRVRINPDEKIGSIPLKTLFDHHTGHVILFGHPGAGKTTSMKYLCQLIFFDDSFKRETFSFPILIRLRDLNAARNGGGLMIIDRLYEILGLRLTLPQEVHKQDGVEAQKMIEHQEAIKEKLVISVLEGLKVLLILDGFDELARSSNRALQEIKTLATHLEHSTFIVTCRTGEFVHNIDNTVQYEICALNKSQISEFAVRWLGDKRKARDFLRKVYASPFADTTIRPLTVAHLCAIYERIGKIPDKPKTIYKKIISLLLEEWDEQKSVKRTSRYARFEVDRKFEFLCQLAYIMTVLLQRTVFSKEDLLRVYTEIYQNYDLVQAEAQQVVGELETHTGLVLQSGYDMFEFAHKSLQEYLAAEYIVRLPSIPNNPAILYKLPNELAIAVAISSNSTDYISELVLQRFASTEFPSQHFLQVFLSRLLLEKPDFGNTTRLSLALVSLYTTYVRLLVGKRELNEYDGAISEFGEWMSKMINQTAIRVIQDLYQNELTYEPKRGEVIYRMRRKPPTKKAQPHAGLPDVLYVKRQWLGISKER
jgi:hypothetical protein